MALAIAAAAKQSKKVQVALHAVHRGCLAAPVSIATCEVQLNTLCNGCATQQLQAGDALRASCKSQNLLPHSAERMVSAALTQRSGRLRAQQSAKPFFEIVI
jgi:hypothetical protein